jgi:hypothetical protein
LERDRDIARLQAEFAKIDAAREQKLISMSAPLVGEMATALRRSATSLDILAESDVSAPKKILYLNREMARDIEVARVDEEITPILGDIFQYNKDNGWGKVRVKLADGVLSFNVPADRRDRLQRTMLDAMKADEVYLQVYIVRDRAHIPCRLILVGVLPKPV